PGRSILPLTAAFGLRPGWPGRSILPLAAAFGLRPGWPGRSILPLTAALGVQPGRASPVARSIGPRACRSLVSGTVWGTSRPLVAVLPSLKALLSSIEVSCLLGVDEFLTRVTMLAAGPPVAAPSPRPVALAIAHERLARSLGRLPQAAAREPLHDRVGMFLLKPFERGQQFVALRGAERGGQPADEDRPVCKARRHVATYSNPRRFIFSTRVVRLMRSTSAALLRLPRVRSSARRIRSFSIDDRYSLRSIPSSGRSTYGAAVAGGASCISGSRSPTSISGRDPRIVTARSTAFSSWRTLPGQLNAIMARMAPCEIVGGASGANLLTKCLMRSGMSSRRSRSGGSVTWKTFNR